MNLTRTPLRVHGEEVTLDEVLLPATGEWLLDGDLEDAVRDREILTTFRAPFTLTQASVFFAQIWLFHELDDEGNPKLHTCKVEVYIRRNPMVYFTKGVLLTIAVVLGSLLTAGYLHPEEHIGDRCAVLFIAFLILITNMQTDLGLGRLSALLWLDIFNLVQLMLVLVACAETILVHNLLKRQEDLLATSIDFASRHVFIWGIYPVVTISTLLVFLQRETAGWLFCAVGVPLSIAVFWLVRNTPPSRATASSAHTGALLLAAPFVTPYL
mmetsp:Transcript_14315/g.42586  ORF Transcript_14315/g.42586 Transcript_14315/m.42586 type:complete len:269 (+) Transcript_14315:224-1030(+)